MDESLLQDGGAGEGLGYAVLPFGGAGLMDAGSFAVYRYRYGHVDYFELVDGFHA